jgi:tellurite methyltransferase
MNQTRDLSTAHRVWDERWSDHAMRQDWATPEPAVVRSVSLMRQRGVRTVLDLGCGIGRHALYLAGEGFEVTGLDASRAGLDATRATAERAGLPVRLCLGTFTDLPFRSACFDAVLSWNVIYHGDGDVARQAIAEIERTLTPDGLFQGTMISKRHYRYGQGTEIRPNTFVIDEDQEKSHPHFYCDRDDLIALLHGFKIIRLDEREHREPDSHHLEFVAALRPDRGRSTV